jgi:hypothetical protein
VHFTPPKQSLYGVRICVCAFCVCVHRLCRHVRSSLRSAVDTTKLALWGTSFAGGHVLVVSSEPEFRDHITAVVTQVSSLFVCVSKYDHTCVSHI